MKRPIPYFMYTILKASTPEELAQLVTDKLNEGWVCQGGIFQHLDPYTGYVWFYQAIVPAPETQGPGKPDKPKKKGLIQRLVDLF